MSVLTGPPTGPFEVPSDTSARRTQRNADRADRGLHAVDGVPSILAAFEGGQVGTRVLRPVRDRGDLARLYSPGVSSVCEAIAAEPALAARYTMRSRTVAVISDASAVHGLGDAGPRAALPLMESKAMLMSAGAGLDAMPLCLQTGSAAELVDTISRLAPTFGGIVLEDISSPRCFEIEKLLQERLDVPVLHADQHGTAVATLAALRNAAHVVGKRFEDLRVVICGAGAAGTATGLLLTAAGVHDVVVGDRVGIVSRCRDDLEEHQHRLAFRTNPRRLAGELGAAYEGADVFIGASGARVTLRRLQGMAPDPILFALANPRPEVDPGVAGRFAAVVATGRSDLPNQVNSALVIPGIFRAALDLGLVRITTPMLLAVADAVAALVPEPTAACIVPGLLDERLVPTIAGALSPFAEA
ncbi:malate dehydrogenase (oxaloacetate-decarboxylating) [Kineosphaera limosa]|uniref:Putative malate dehydrogenase n=1 Tax=Kineosphaera limosa NBRC 100340 TaxID=1184609 RepID=K6WYA1_9MICO|nr:malic enzyme-like NAD(P)-binding protein [Kineosphaera limosa]NYE01981.1 malate dehydrogenase (oxaloacetate-decarboxylating) [Kineosphaera limosa]GAB97087.1 putative malate dehydrogenase [Kineosphaera limosa NBRC 100340]